AIAVTLAVGAAPLSWPAEQDAAEHPPFKVSGKFSRAVQKYTGINKVTSTVSSGVATFVLRSRLHGRSKVKIKTYSFTDLLSGKARGFDVMLKDAAYEGIPIRDIEMHSTT